MVKLPGWDYSFLWLHPLDVSSDAGFVALDKRFHRERIFGGTETLQTLDRSIRDQGLARRFVFNTRGELRQGNRRAHEIMTVTRDGIAHWKDRDNHDNTPFR